MRPMLAALCCAALVACGPQAGDGTQLANPASVYCGQHGGTVEIRGDDRGAQHGACVFDDGSECDEWAFYRGECTPGQHPAARGPSASDDRDLRPRGAWHGRM